MFPILGSQLTQLIPQKEPFVLISSLQAVNDTNCITTFTFTSQHVLCFNGELSMAGLLENIAQSAGCKLGFEDFTQGKKTRLGFIGEIRDFEFLRLPKVGEELITEIIIEGKVFGSVTLLRGKVSCNNQAIAFCKMKVFFEPEAEL